jgi:hypothetical protein
MTGAFNVAIAPFGVTDSSGKLQSSPDGSKLSLWLYQALDEQQHKPNLLPDGFAPQFWTDSDEVLPYEKKSATIGLVADSSSAQQAARHVGAHMVVYGALDGDRGTAHLAVQFHVPLLNGEADEVEGSHQFGAPLTVHFPLDGAIGGGGDLTSQLSLRARALIWFAAGLEPAFEGEHERALRIFQQAQNGLTDWPDQQNGQSTGKEVLYLFIGREARLAHQDSVALDNFEKAKSARPNYARAFVGEGNLHYAQAGCTSSTQTLDGDEIGQAIAAYGSAVEYADSRLTQIRAQLGLGLALQCAADDRIGADNFDAASVFVDRSLASVNDILENSADAGEQQLAHAFFLAGLADTSRAKIYLGQGNHDAELHALQDASVAFEACLARDTNDLPDAFLEKLKADYCRPDKQVVEGEITTLLAPAAPTDTGDT